MEFDLHKELLGIQDKNIQFTFKLQLDEYNSKEIDRRIDSLTDILQDEPGILIDIEVFDSIKSFIL